MTDNDSLKVLTAFFEAFNRNDLDTASKFVTDDIVYTIRGRSSLSKTYRGPEEFAWVLQEIKRRTAGTMSVIPEVVLADDKNIMMYLHATGQRPDGRRYDNYQAYLYRLRDGKLAEGQTIPVDQLAFEKFFDD
ncbi:MAG: nuclear transport factor 2 family protein [Rhodocyclaceae bacterium]|nr:nuclear transport factor 2 family protein [Rhodocyclaceae bacterium]